MSGETQGNSNELLDALKERLNSPVFGTYLIFFVFWNWKAILTVLLSDSSIEFTIREIEESTSHLSAFGVPIVATATYLFVFPWFSNAANLYRSFSNHIVMKWTMNFSSEVIRGKNHQQRLVEIISSQEKLNESEREWSRLNNDLSKAQAKHQATLKEIETKRKDNDELNDKLVIAREKYDETMGELETANKRNSDLRSTFERAHTRYEQLREEIYNLDYNRNELEKGQERGDAVLNSSFDRAFEIKNDGSPIILGNSRVSMIEDSIRIKLTSQDNLKIGFGYPTQLTPQIAEIHLSRAVSSLNISENDGKSIVLGALCIVVSELDRFTHRLTPEALENLKINLISIAAMSDEFELRSQIVEKIGLTQTRIKELAGELDSTTSKILNSVLQNSNVKDEEIAPRPDD